MRSIFSLFILFAVCSLAYSYKYHVHVNLGSKPFETIRKAVLNMVVAGPFSSRVYKIRESILFPSTTHIADVEMNYTLEEMQKVKFFFTLIKPHKGNYSLRKPIIYLDSLKIVDTDKSSSVEALKFFIAPDKNQQIAPDQEIELLPKYYVPKQ